MLLLPWHLWDSLGDGLNVTLPDGTVEVWGEPATGGEPWRDLVALYRPLADAVAGAVAEASEDVTVLTGDCVSAIPVLAGLQRQGHEPAMVWFDAHGDFHTEETTTSGYLGGLPLAKVVGRGDLTLPHALGMRPIAEERAVLVDARDLDPAEAVALAASGVRHVAVADLAAADLPAGPVHLHVDLDVLDPADLHGLRFPAPGGPAAEALVAAVATVAGAREIVGLSIAATWRPEDTQRDQTDRALAAVLEAAGRT